MNAHAQVLAGPASTSTTIFPDSQYRFPSPSGVGFLYGPDSGYASFTAPRSSSSSLASALDPGPEPIRNSSSDPPLRPVEHSSEQLDGGQFVNQSASSSAEVLSEILSRRTDMSTNGFAKSSERQFDDSGAFRAQHQIYQGTDPEIHALNQSQSMGHYSYAPMQSSSSASYVPPQQSASYIQSNGSQWPPDVPFPAYAEHMSMPPALATNVGEPFPAFPQDYPYMGVGEGNPDVYGSTGSAEGWVHARGNPPLQGSDGSFLGFDNGSNSAENAWFSDSFGQQDGFQNASFAATSMSFPTPVTEISTGQSSASSSDGTTESGYFGESQNNRQQSQQEDDLTAIQRQYHPASQAHGEEVSESLMTPQEQQPGPSSSQSDAHPLPLISSTNQRADSHQGSGGRKQYRGHNELMPPPPLPPRAHTLATERQQHAGHLPQTTPERRHSVTAPSPHNELQDENASPTLASIHPSSATSESSSSSGRQDDSVRTKTPRPRTATLALNDALWQEAQERNRDKLAESFQILHGRDPPPEMRIRETSALERSRKDEHILLGTTLSKQVTGQANQPQSAETESSGQSAHGSEGTDVADRPSVPPASDSMSEEEFFNPREDWVPARSGEELAREAQAQANTLSLTSPISPTTTASTEGLITPTSDTSAPSAVRRVQMKYAFHAPANPDTVIRPLSSPLAKNVLAVMRHDGHLPQHISGVGGTFQNAYDGRSYLTDDSEDDPDHVPPAPPGARTGDHPVLAALRPHPLEKRGQAWHDLINPTPPSIRGPGSVQQGGSHEHEITPTEDDAAEIQDAKTLAGLEKEGVKEEEQGEGWGFTEGGSHGPKFALSGSRKPGSQGRRLKLTTEKKTPPKMACHFCRNRKIACGPSKCGDPTICNQCERRNIRCIFPTESRRGMRTKNPRPTRLVEGTDEVDSGSLDCDDGSENGPSGSGSSKKSARPSKESGKDGKEKDGGKGKGKGKRKAGATENVEESSSKRTNGRNEQSDPSAEQSGQPAHYANDPLASLAAEMQWSTSQSHSAPSTSTMDFETTTSANFHASSSSSLSGALHIPTSFEISFPASNLGANYFGPSSGPFTSAPLQRRA